MAQRIKSLPSKYGSASTDSKTHIKARQQWRLPGLPALWKAKTGSSGQPDKEELSQNGQVLDA